MNYLYIGIIAVFLFAIVYFLFSRKKVSRKSAMDQESGAVDRYALVDRETGLYNKRFFLKKIEEEMDKSIAFKSSFTVAILNLPSKFNNHEEKEVILRKVGTILARDVRFSDVVSRFGPANIGILYPMTSSKGAETPTYRLKTKVNDLLETAGIDEEAYFTLISYPEKKNDIDKFISELKT